VPRGAGTGMAIGGVASCESRVLSEMLATQDSGLRTKPMQTKKGESWLLSQ